MEYEKTQYPGIKKRSDGKYLVTLEYGVQRVIDKKTGDVKEKRKKTNRITNTLAEAKALRREAEKKREEETYVAEKEVPFDRSMEEFLAYYKNTLSHSSYERQCSYARRADKYFGSMDLRKIDTLEIENFFRWCLRDDTAKDMKAVKTVTVQKIRSMLNKAWNYFLKGKRYGIKENVITNAELPKDDAPSFRGTALSEQEMNRLLYLLLQYEKDYSSFALVGLAMLAGLRRGEIAGLKWGDIEPEGRIHIVRQRASKLRTSGDDGQNWEWRVPKKGDEHGSTPEERKERYAACPECLRKLLSLVKQQQEEYLERPVTDDDLVYMEKVNLVDGYLPAPDKMSRHFATLKKSVNRNARKEGLPDLPDIRLHDLRHTFTSVCLNHKVYSFMVSASLGHTSGILPTDIVTFSTYWHDDGKRQEINDCIDAVVKIPIRVPEFSGKRAAVYNHRANKKNCEL